MTDSSVSIIVPTYKESPNIRPLVERISLATKAAGLTVEIVIVDDNSQDGTVEIIESLSSDHPVRIKVRKNERGLAGAVIAGFREAKYDQFVVLDADLQHPPEAIRRLLERLNEPGCDFAIATRYAAKGSIDEAWSTGRRFASCLATLAARPLAPLSDPMSGFFAFRRQTFQHATKLNAIGYKIALELFVKCGCRSPGEVPIEFSIRNAGQSKAGLREGMRFLRHLVSLYWFKWPIAMAASIGSSVLIVTAIVYFLCRAMSR
ncbi:MAG: polyprenol monophosphomannose synthase [Planctomycetes bacterium]|nr:polyprenol monophosphomannose synthase [Planctomycetota bacterium]MBI3835548.1 polyprenol monophosphomannose synthase [Planctomycetota bacterium]